MYCSNIQAGSLRDQFREPHLRLAIRTRKATTNNNDIILQAYVKGIKEETFVVRYRRNPSFMCISIMLMSD